MFLWRVDVNCHYLIDLPYLYSAWITQRRILKSWWNPVPCTEGSQKVGENGRQLLSPSLSKYLSQGLCHHHRLWIPFVPVFRYKKSARVCQQDRFYTLEMRGWERDRERSFILSMPLHQHSDHIAFISDPATLLCLYSSFLFWFIYHLHRWKQNFLLCIGQSSLFFQEMLHCHCCSHKEQLVASCKKNKHWPLKPTGIFKIKQDKTTH